ncbi:uncharacterized protein A4U43_C08F34930 [Asparagus officinalis]|uniref:protein UPSTREAM OF FLC-like n=1 Tax=Asparagus officinalis TaxID=4686 RepID=UPI00098E302B|nr:protein UPSTREAM OF FLC-like [Asparagus officinalis]ONK61920.1 uncharacterized protein A4U43_C08F34930 [Asparagus officinalis]
MEVSSRRRAELSRERSTSPERTRVWAEPKPRPVDRKVSVVYYLSRNGHLEHPHFMEVSVGLGEGLYLRDVIKRLNSLRGKGMANLYSWSSKRSYKNGFVWHDLIEDDFIYPAHGNEYILKGSELLKLDSSQDDTQEVRSSKSIQDDSNIPIRSKNRTHWGSFDLCEYKVNKNKITLETSIKNTDAWTQTEDKGVKAQSSVIKEEEVEEEEEEENAVTELNRNEISPPSSSSSSETLEGLIKADGTVAPIGANGKDKDVGNCSRRKIKTPMALMQLISCGSISVKDKGFSLVSHFKGRMPRVMSGEVKESEGSKRSNSFSPELEEKEYFSGSLIELKKKASGANGEFSSLRRSSSCNAERGLKMELAEKEIDGVRARCIPRRPKATAGKREADVAIGNSVNESKIIDESPENN